MSRFPDLSNEYVLVIDDRVKDPKTNFLTSLRQQIKRKAGALPYIGGSAR
jgi:phenylacetate-CoA ligase